MNGIPKFESSRLNGVAKIERNHISTTYRIYVIPDKKIAVIDNEEHILCFSIKNFELP